MSLPVRLSRRVVELTGCSRAEVGPQWLGARHLRIGRITLGKGRERAMPAGQWRDLPADERF